MSDDRNMNFMRLKPGPAHSPSRLGDDTGPPIFWGPKYFFYMQDTEIIVIYLLKANYFNMYSLL